jgi:hypothetical protein
MFNVGLVAGREGIWGSGGMDPPFEMAVLVLGVSRQGVFLPIQPSELQVTKITIS